MLTDVNTRIHGQELIGDGWVGGGGGTLLSNTDQFPCIAQGWGSGGVIDRCIRKMPLWKMFTLSKYNKNYSNGKKFVLLV